MEYEFIWMHVTGGKPLVWIQDVDLFRRGRAMLSVSDDQQSLEQAEKLETEQVSSQ